MGSTCLHGGAGCSAQGCPRHIELTLVPVFACCCCCRQHFQLRRPFVGQGAGVKKGAGKGSRGQHKAGSGGVAWKQDSAAAAAASASAADADDDDDGTAAAAAEDNGNVFLGGMKQEEQERVIDQFRAGTVQVLLATCIGEEGLDVPQVQALYL